jgi:ABC-2 type transport system permease protein
MSGFAAFVRKEFEEIRKTSRMWVLPGIMLFFGLTSPILAKLTPLLIRSTAGSQPGMTIQMPDPTYIDAYRGFAQNLTQIMVIAVVIATAGIISREVRSGAAALVLVKPVSRGAMVMAKALGQVALLSAAGVLGSLICWGATAVAFGTAPVGPLAAALGLWVALAVLFTAFMILMSAAMNSQAGASGIGLGAFAVLAILSAWGVTRDYTPAGLFGAISEAVAGEQVKVLWPLVTTVVLTVVLLDLAVHVFRRREI